MLLLIVWSFCSLFQPWCPPSLYQWFPPSSPASLLSSPSSILLLCLLSHGMLTSTCFICILPWSPENQIDVDSISFYSCRTLSDLTLIWIYWLTLSSHSFPTCILVEHTWEHIYMIDTPMCTRMRMHARTHTHHFARQGVNRKTAG